MTATSPVAVIQSALCAAAVAIYAHSGEPVALFVAVFYGLLIAQDVFGGRA